MSVLRRLIYVCFVLLLFSGVGVCAGTQVYVDRVQKILSEKNVRSMMDVSKALKEHGASFQGSLLLPAGISGDLDQGQNVHLLIGAYQFDALYAASFGRTEKAVAAVKDIGVLINTTNLATNAKTSVLFPPELNWMLREPDAVDIDDVIKAYAANAPNYKHLMADRYGFDIAIDSVYGGMIEGLYIATQSAVAMGDSVASNALLDEFRANIDLVLSLYRVFESDVEYANNVDEQMFLERSQRLGWMESLAGFLRSRNGKLTMGNIEAIGRFVARERAELLLPELNDL